MRASPSVAVVVVLASASAARTAAWGSEGHHIVARIAWSQMTDAAKHAAQDLLGTADFIASSTWADEVRPRRPETYNWHFVNIPYGARMYDGARDCKVSDRGDCVIAELTRAQHAIGNTTLSKDQRTDALKFLIHFVGDLHQPLHAIDNHDRGGNDVHVTIAGRRTTNLHSVWDSVLINSRSRGEAAYANFLIEDVKVHPVPQRPIDYIAWAQAAHEVAVKDAYSYPGFSPAGPPSGTVPLGESYVTKAQPLVDRELELAGVRLAMILNRVLGEAVMRK
jgi:nuclease S1